MSTTTQPVALLRRQATSLLRDYAELMKLRVTTLIVMTAWCGYYSARRKPAFRRCPGDFFTLAGDRPCLQWNGGAE